MNKYLIALAVSTFAFSQAEAACGTFKVSKGDVKISRSGKVSPAPEGSQICSGDKVMAGAASRARIEMDDGNVLNILPETDLVLEKYEFNPTENKKKVLLNVLKGKVRTATAKENMYNDKADDGQANTFQVKTKSAVAGVRGTDFMSGYNPATKKAEFVTFKGKVDVGTLGPNGRVTNVVQVTAGMISGVPLGEKPEPPKPLPAAELNRMNLDTTATTTSPDKNGPPAGRDSSEEKNPNGEGPKPGPSPGAGTNSDGSNSTGNSAGNTSGNSSGNTSGNNAGNTGGNSAGPVGGTSGTDSGPANGTGGRTPANTGADPKNATQRPPMNATGPGMGAGSGTSPGMSPGMGTMPPSMGMIGNSELGGGTGFANLPNLGQPPPVYVPPPLPVLPPAPHVCEFCNQIPGNAKLKVIINN